jgi:hypothetical protein
LWDSGGNAVDELNRLMKVRAAAMKRFGENNIREGDPMATLEDVLVPLYLLHRYQVEAAAKVLGGIDYTFALRGDALTALKPVPAAEQRRALDAVLATLTPGALALPEQLLRMIPPRPPEYPRGREHFRTRTSPAFDALSPAETAANTVMGFLLNQERAARLVEYHARDSHNPGFAEVVDKILAATWKAPAMAGYDGEIQRTVDGVVLNYLMLLAANDRVENQVRAIAALKLEELKTWLTTGVHAGQDESQKAFFFFAAGQIKRFQIDPKDVHLSTSFDPPDGSPIGVDSDWGN